jgi:hypothetical protein
MDLMMRLLLQIRTITKQAQSDRWTSDQRGLHDEKTHAAQRHQLIKCHEQACHTNDNSVNATERICLTPA